MPQAAGTTEEFTYRHILWQSLPLILTFLMISGSAPIVTGGIAIKYAALGEKEQLSSFLICFCTALFLYSPVFSARNIAVRTIKDRRSLLRVASFYAILCSACCLSILAVSLNDSCSRFVFQDILSCSDASMERSRQGLLYFAPAPIGHFAVYADHQKLQ